MKKQIITNMAMAIAAFVFVLVPALSNAGPVPKDAQQNMIISESGERLVQPQVQTHIQQMQLHKVEGVNAQALQIQQRAMTQQAMKAQLRRLQMMAPLGSEVLDARKILAMPPQELSEQKVDYLKWVGNSVLPNFKGKTMDKDVMIIGPDGKEVQFNGTINGIVKDVIVGAEGGVDMVAGTALVPLERGQWMQANFVARLGREGMMHGTGCLWLGKFGSKDKAVPTLVCPRMAKDDPDRIAVTRTRVPGGNWKDTTDPDYQPDVYGPGRDADDTRSEVEYDSLDDDPDDPWYDDDDTPDDGDEIPRPWDDDDRGGPRRQLEFFTRGAVFATIVSNVDSTDLVSLWNPEGEGGGHGPGVDPVAHGAAGGIPTFSQVSASFCPTRPKGGGPDGDPVPTISSPVSGIASSGSVSSVVGDPENGVCGPGQGDPVPVTLKMMQRAN